MTNTYSRFLSEIVPVYDSFLLKDYKIRFALSDSLAEGSMFPPYREAALPQPQLSAHQDCADNICPPNTAPSIRPLRRGRGSPSLPWTTVGLSSEHSLTFPKV